MCSVCNPSICKVETRGLPQIQGQSLRVHSELKISIGLEPCLRAPLSHLPTKQQQNRLEYEVKQIFLLKKHVKF